MAAFRQKTQLLWLTAAALILAPVPVFSFSLCPGGKCPVPKKQEFDAQSEEIIWLVSHNPALMNVNFLQYYIGHPENEDTAQFGSPHYKWYGPQRETTYELLQTSDGRGNVTESTMIVHLEGMGLTFESLDKLYGNQSRRFFDYSGHANELFSFAPDTTVSFAEPGNSFKLKTAKIIYRGAPLPQPTPEDMALAESTMIARAREAHLAQGKIKGKGHHNLTPQETLPMAMTRLQSQPFNAEAHLHLAEEYQKQAKVHEAIGEYKLALALSGDDPDVRDQALKALDAMGLLPPENPQPRRNLEIVDHGQHIRVVGNEKQSQDDGGGNDQGANGQPF